MDNTGIIKKGLDPLIRKILFSNETSTLEDSDLVYSIWVDKAHIAMLLKQGLISVSQYDDLLSTIEELEKENFSSLQGQDAGRGIYLLYEDYLIEKLGIETGGVLQTGRSRNDLKATVLLLKLRKPFISLLLQSAQLVQTLITKSDEYQSVIMPVFTHYQAAVPVTYGHYLQGIAFAVLRDIGRILGRVDGLNICPIGACAVGGSSIPIDNLYVAEKLGFSAVFFNSIDAVASRDATLALQSDIVLLATSISRLTTDLQLWSSSGFDFFILPDEIVGSSSIMPNKRNAFILENIQGKCMNAGTGFWAATTNLHKTPFSNSIVVGTEAMENIWQSFKLIEDAILLLNLFINKAVPNCDKMLKSTIEGNTFATELANHLVKHKVVSFREAHKIIGEYIYQTFNEKSSFHQVIDKMAKNYNVNFDFSPEKLINQIVFGGGPGKTVIHSNFHILIKEIEKVHNSINKIFQQWNEAINKLNNK